MHQQGIQHHLWWVWLASVMVLFVGCQPATPEPVAMLPTIAALPTITPIPTITPTPTPFPTFTHTPTPTITPTPPPTYTPRPDRTAEDCKEVAEVAVQSSLLACDFIELGDACYGSALIRADRQVGYTDGDVFLSVGNVNRADDISQMAVSGMQPSDGVWGISVLWLRGDLNGAFPDLNRLTMIVMGEANVDNLLTSQDEQQAALSSYFANNRPNIEPAFSRMTVFTRPSAQPCDSYPSGVLLQSQVPTALEVNRLSLNLDGTIFVRADNAQVTEIMTLEGAANVVLEGEVFDIPLGTTFSVNLDGNFYPLGRPLDLKSYDTRFDGTLFDEMLPLLDEMLARPIDPPPAVLPDNLEQLNTYSDVWTVQSDVTYLAGMYETGEAVTTALKAEVREVCSWQGAWFVGEKPTGSFTVIVSPDKTFAGIAGDYPQTNYPIALDRIAPDVDIYTGAITDSLNGITYEHTLTFTSPTTFEWELNVSGLPAGRCQEASVVGVGQRTPGEPSQSQIQTVSSQSWNVDAAPGDFMLPVGEFIADCAEYPAYLPPFLNAQLTTRRQSGSLGVDIALEGIPFPDALTVSDSSADTYIGAAANGNERYDHEFIFVEADTVLWRAMVRAIDRDCRLGAFQATGSIAP
jgi:hypothetical protein